MKKLLRIFSIILLVLTIITLFIIIAVNLYFIIKIGFFGMTVGSNQYPDTIWWGEIYLYGYKGIQQYYSNIGKALLLVEFPIAVLSIIYQIVFFKVLNKK